jgi:hypothetical protein
MPIALDNQCVASVAALRESKMSSSVPNPFTRETKVKYEVEKEGKVKIGVFDSDGNLVDLLLDAWQTKGVYSIKIERKALNAGVCFVQVHTDSATLVRKLIVL